MGKIGTTSTRYHHIVTSKYGRFLCNPIPSFRFLFFDLMNGSVFLCSPIVQKNPVGEDLIWESDGLGRLDSQMEKASVFLSSKNVPGN